MSKRPFPTEDTRDTKRAKIGTYPLYVVHTILSDYVPDLLCSIGGGSTLYFQSEEDRDIFCNRMLHYSNGRYVGVEGTMIDMRGYHRSTDHMVIHMYTKAVGVPIFKGDTTYILGGSKILLGP